MKITEQEATEQYDEYINEIEHESFIQMLPYTQAGILKELDPIAYNCGMTDWLDMEGAEVE